MKSYIIRIELEGSNPLIWRQVILPAGATYNRLHDIIQNITNFKSGYPYEACHLYEFDLVDENRIVTNNEEAYDEHVHYKKNKKLFEERLKSIPLDMLEFEQNHQKRLKRDVKKPTGLKIDAYLENFKYICYRYDFSAGWCFSIRLEAVVEDYYFGYATVLNGAETAPPEGVKGIDDYYEFLKIYNDKRHPDHKEIVEWATPQHYKRYDKVWLNRSLKGISYKKTEWDKINHLQYKIIENKYRTE